MQDSLDPRMSRSIDGRIDPIDGQRSTAEFVLAEVLKWSFEEKWLFSAMSRLLPDSAPSSRVHILIH